MPKQSDWLKNLAIPIKTTAPGSGIGDLIPLKGLIGDARIVGLGEATHSTHEFFTIKHRLVEFLVQEMGFTTFAMEANAPEADRINDYILHGTGDPKELLRGMHFWTWNTQEILDLIEWMKTYNLSGQKSGLIRFAGFDMQYSEASIKIVLDFIERAEPGYRETASSAYQVHEKAESVKSHLEKNRDEYAKTCSLEDINWAIHNANIINQSSHYKSETTLEKQSELRDVFMAENTEWICSQNPAAMIILWAHNYHVGRKSDSMGRYLSEKYDADYLPICFCFHEGQYNTRSNDGILSFAATPSHPGCYEWLLHNSGMPQFALDLRKASEDNNSSTWIKECGRMHDVGAVKQDDDFRASDIIEEFDAMIYIDKTTPSIILEQSDIYHQKV